MGTQEIRNTMFHQKYRSLSYGSRVVPEIRLSGVWLEALGFEAKVSVDIRVSRGQLIITPERMAHG